MAYLWGAKRNTYQGVLQCRQKHQHSISGFSFHYGIGVISLSSKIKNVIALLSTETEYVGQTHAAKEAMWLQSFVSEVQGKGKRPLTILCDNQGAIALAKNNKYQLYHARTKHIDLRYHFICEAVEDGKINVKYIQTDENVSDIFTKALPKPRFQCLAKLLG